MPTADATDRVAHVTWAFVGPSTPWIYDLATQNDRYQSSVLCERRENADQYPHPRARATLPMPPGTIPTRVRHRLLRQVGREPPYAAPWHFTLRRECRGDDVVHAHFGPVGWYCVEAQLRIPVVTTFYGYDASERETLRYWRRGYDRLFAEGSAFLVEGPAMKRALEQIGAPPDRTYVQPLLADVADIEWRPPPDGPPVVAMAGRFVDKKGFDDGLRAFRQVASRYRDASMLVIGDGPLDEELRRLVSDLRLDGRVRFVGFQPRAEYRRLLAESHIFLQPSRVAGDGETEGGAPTTLLDAQATGLVVVATRHADIPFVVDANAAALVPERDPDGLAGALEASLEHRGEWRKRTEAGRDHVARQHGRAVVMATLERHYDTARGRSGERALLG